MLGCRCPLLRVAAQPYLRRDPCSEIKGLACPRKGVEDPRDPGSESNGLACPRKWVEDPRDPGSEIKGYACPRRFFGESARGGFFSEKAALSQIVIL